jgi:3-oxoacyl-[acyl-carrier protein] reductase
VDLATQHLDHAIVRPAAGASVRLRNKTALVTGAGQGFGRGIAEAFVREGALVALLDLNEDAAIKAAEELGPAAFAIRCDVADGEDVARAADEAIRGLGHLDILVNNAGTTHRNQPMLDVTEAEFDRVFAVNVKSIYHLAKAVVPHFRARGHGIVLNISSTAGDRPRPGLAWYNASKGAVSLLTKSMAVELAPDKIRVNALAPVAGETPLLAAFMGEDTPEKRAAFTASVPWGRLSTPQDIANAALFLCSDDADMITGSVLAVDGGRCI